MGKKMAGMHGNRTHHGHTLPATGFEVQRAHQDSSIPTNIILPKEHRSKLNYLEQPFPRLLGQDLANNPGLLDTDKGLGILLGQTEEQAS